MMNPRATRQHHILALSAAVLLPALCAQLCAAQPVAIAPGVSVEALRDPDGPWEIRVIRIERDGSQAQLTSSHPARADGALGAAPPDGSRCLRPAEHTRGENR